MYESLAKMAVFAGVLLAPLLSFVFGVVPPYGAPQPDLPAPSDLLSGGAGVFDQLGDAILRRSAANKLAITARNWTAYHWFGFVDTPKVVSGRQGWLFYKPELGMGRCVGTKQAMAAFGHVDALFDLADAAGVSLTMSISPDKAVVYPDMLDPRVEMYWWCKADSAATLRSAMALQSPRFVDHAEVLRAARWQGTRTDIYMHTDTHWTPYGGALALSQLLGSVRPELGAPAAPKLTPDRTARPTDLRNSMLVLPDRERVRDLDDDAELSRLEPYVQASEGTVIVHDSFYGSLKPWLTKVFPGAVYIHHDHAESAASALLEARRIIVNSVERLFMHRTTNGIYAQGAALELALLKKASARSADCGAFRPISLPALVTADDGDSGAEQVRVIERGLTPDGRDPRVTVAVPPAETPGSICLRFHVQSAAAAQLELFLPSHGPRLRFEAGRSVGIEVPAGEHVVALVLPDYVAGKGLRLDLGDAPGVQSTLTSLELGVLPRPTAGEL